MSHDFEQDDQAVQLLKEVLSTALHTDGRYGKKLLNCNVYERETIKTK